MKMPPLESADGADKLIIQSLAKLDALALGIAVGTLCGLVIFLATNVLIFKGGEEIGPNLALLSQYFVGYEVTETGSLIGLIYGFIFGFITGSLIAFLRNAVVGVYLHLLKLKSRISAVNDFIDNP
jgi:cell shape-determining protein MreD